MEPQILISICALVISTGALLLSRQTFFESHRPIVTAEIRTHDADNTATLFSLMVHNVGNRPACEIRLRAKQTEINKVVNSETKDTMSKAIYTCFSDNGIIPILHPGKSTKNSFGASSVIEQENVLVYQAQLPIKVTYKDLNGVEYSSKLTLIVKDSESFAGSFWSEQKRNENA